MLSIFSDSENNLIFVCGTFTYSNNPDLFNPNIHSHQHEEPGYHNPNALACIKTDGDIRDIDINSPYIDTLALLIDLVAVTKLKEIVIKE